MPRTSGAAGGTPTSSRRIRWRWRTPSTFSRRGCRRCRSTGRRTTRSSATTWSSSRRSSSRASGMFLLGRELTGSRSAGVVAGLAYAFSPFRIASIPHLQVLSSAWMPFVLYGLRRHFSTGRLAPACRRRRRVDRAEPVVRLLPAVLQPGRRPLHRLGADDARVVDRSTGTRPRGGRMRAWSSS